MEKKFEILIYAIPNRCPNAFYFGKFRAMDAILMFGYQNKKIGVISPLDLTRAKEEGNFDEILNLNHLRDEARSKFRSASLADIIHLLSEKYHIEGFLIPDSFPARIFSQLTQKGINLEFRKPFFPERLIKSQNEADAIKKGNQISQQGFDLVKETLLSSEIRKDKKLIYKEKELTFETLRKKVRNLALEKGASTGDSIIAGGIQAAQPHCLGHGVVKSDELIIVDIFPQMEASRYHGDLTRTFLLGTPNEDQIKIVETVKKAHQRALDALKPNISGEKIDSLIRKCFVEAGFPTGEKNGTPYGCFCGIGHGLGLNIHEEPFLGKNCKSLKEGMVITIELGLYYQDLGSCRIEDVVLMTETGWKFLNDYSYNWQLNK